MAKCLDMPLFVVYDNLCEFGESSTIESCLQRAIDAYSMAVNWSLKANMPFELSVTFGKRHGNALNELGTRYLGQAVSIISQPGYGLCSVL